MISGGSVIAGYLSILGNFSYLGNFCCDRETFFRVTDERMREYVRVRASELRQACDERAGSAPH